MSELFREHHTLEIMTAYESQNLPLDKFINIYFRNHKALGSKDRRDIGDRVYRMIRWRGLIDHYCEKPITWAKRQECIKQLNIEEARKDKSIPWHVRVSFPKGLYDLIVESHGEEKGRAICVASNTKGPTCIRANLLKSSREALFDRLKDRYALKKTELSPWGLIFLQTVHVYSLPEFQEGLFELQDEGSQLLSGLVRIKPGQKFLDYCAGSGGKTLAIAPQLLPSGRIYVHDIRKDALDECRKRLQRAGITHAEVLYPGTSRIELLKDKMDWVLIDVPCSSTGALRRSPDMKWKFTEEKLADWIQEQRKIFEKALKLVRVGGKIVYTTCSLLKQENQEQIAFFRKKFPVAQDGPAFQSVPQEGGMDGFFGTVLERMA